MNNRSPREQFIDMVMERRFGVQYDFDGHANEDPKLLAKARLRAEEDLRSLDPVGLAYLRRDVAERAARIEAEYDPYAWAKS
jgi:hypothetical protein